MQRMIADSFSIDVYCANLNQDDLGDSAVECERNRSMLQESPLRRSPSLARLQSRPSRNLCYVLPRLLWMALGPASAMVLSVIKLDSRSGTAGFSDTCFWGVIATVLIVRWGTWIAGDRCDTFGGKATFNGLVGFSAIVVGLGTSFWILVNLLAEQSLS